jgi:predicted transcriptional regulator
VVDGRRLELPTSVLRTSGGSGRIRLERNGVGRARRRDRSNAEPCVFTRIQRSDACRLATLPTKTWPIRTLNARYTFGMKTAVSIPDEVFAKVERLARRAGRSRSEVFSAALAEYVARHAPDEVTEAMDRVCADIGEQRDPFVLAAGRRVLEQSEW